MKTLHEIKLLEDYIEELVINHKLNKREHQILLNMLDDETITKEDLRDKAIYLD